MNFIDRSIEIDKSKLPKVIVEILDRMEEYEKNDDEINYGFAIEELEPVIKGVVLNDKLERKYFDILMRKYCGWL